MLLALAFLACGGHHILLRLLSLHLCNEYLSLPKKKKKKKKSAPHQKKLGCKLCKRHSTTFVRPGVVDGPLSLLETLSACWARQGLGVTIAACFFFFFFFFFFFGGKDIHYTSATITTSKKCDVHCKTNKAEANNTS